MWPLFVLSITKKKSTYLHQTWYKGVWWDKEHLIPNTDRCVHRGRNSTHICGPSVLLIDQKQKHLIASNSIDGRMVRGAMAVFEHRPDAFIGGAAAPNLWPLMFP